MKDTLLSDGTFIPKGASVGLAVNDSHMNSEVQELGSSGIPLDQFDPARYVGSRSKRSTAVGADHLIFDVGNHSCPGRYFASQEIRYVLARILDKFDISPTTADGKKAPNELLIVSLIIMSVLEI